ncbi:ethanolamine utilization protein EutJ [Caproiciproducens sp.]
MSRLAEADRLIGKLSEGMESGLFPESQGPVYLGVDVGTANVVSVAVDAGGTPLGGEITPARVVKEGMIIDYLGAVDLVEKQVRALRERLGTEISVGASAIPPGTAAGNARVTQNILESVELTVPLIVDEPTAASKVLGITEGAVVDVGGGTTGISVLKQGKVVYIADEPTGGFHLDLVLAGRLGVSTEEAERIKCDPVLQKKYFVVVRPVFEKISSIILHHVAGRDVRDLFLVGGTCSYPGFSALVEKETGIRTHLPKHPLYVTPLGIALACREVCRERVAGEGLRFGE